MDDDSRKIQGKTSRNIGFTQVASTCGNEISNSCPYHPKNAKLQWNRNHATREPFNTTREYHSQQIHIFDDQRMKNSNKVKPNKQGAGAANSSQFVAGSLSMLKGWECFLMTCNMKWPEMIFVLVPNQLFLFPEWCIITSPWYLSKSLTLNW